MNNKKRIDIDASLFAELDALFKAHKAADSVYHYDDVKDMIRYILDRVAGANGGGMGSEKAALLNILRIEGDQ